MLLLSWALDFVIIKHHPMQSFVYMIACCASAEINALLAKVPVSAFPKPAKLVTVPSTGVSSRRALS